MNEPRPECNPSRGSDHDQTVEESDMAARKLTTRRDFLREYQSIAVQARREGNKEVWRTACIEWCRLATAVEQSKAPAAISQSWAMEG